MTLFSKLRFNTLANTSYGVQFTPAFGLVNNTHYFVNMSPAISLFIVDMKIQIFLV